MLTSSDGSRWCAHRQDAHEVRGLADVPPPTTNTGGVEGALRHPPPPTRLTHAQGHTINVRWNKLQHAETGARCDTHSAPTHFQVLHLRVSYGVWRVTARWRGQPRHRRHSLTRPCCNVGDGRARRARTHRHQSFATTFLLRSTRCTVLPEHRVPPRASPSPPGLTQQRSRAGDVRRGESEQTEARRGGRPVARTPRRAPCSCVV